MGFDDVPSPDTLRKRYLTLAKNYHPDRKGGNEDAFKTLTKMYNFLTERIGAMR